MMRVGDRHRQRVCRVRAGDLCSGKQACDHRVNLHLFGAAGADYGLLDQPRRIFADVETRPRCDHDDDPARLAQLQRRLRIGIDEYLLDSGGVGTVLGDQRVEALCEIGKALGKRGCSVAFQLSVGNVREPITLGFD